MRKWTKSATGIIKTNDEAKEMARLDSGKRARAAPAKAPNGMEMNHSATSHQGVQLPASSADQTKVDDAAPAHAPKKASGANKTETLSPDNEEQPERSAGAAARKTAASRRERKPRMA